MNKGDKIQDVTGEWHEVLEIRDNVIYTLRGKFIHITKVMKVKA